MVNKNVTTTFKAQKGSMDIVKIVHVKMNLRVWNGIQNFHFWVN